MPFEVICLLVVIALLVFTLFLIFLSRYRKCPSDRIMVIYGKVGKNADGTARSSKCIHGGAAFVWPIIQSYQYLDLTPISIAVDLRSALSRQNIRIDVPSIFTVGISTEPGVMQNAAERLLGLKLSEIQELAKDIIFGQLRLVIATMDIEEINTDRDKFLEAVSRNVETELKKIGLRLINVNVTDISDESGYISALGKEAAAKAINDAKKNVAERERDGSIGEALAQKDQRIQVASANSLAIRGENDAKIEVANSEAVRREKAAEAMRLAIAAEKVQAAKALEEAYAAEKEAELSRSAREKATLEADVIVKAEITKREIELAAEAEAEKIRRQAAGEADAIYAKMEAQARGMQEILSKQAAGFEKIVAAAGGDAKNAMMLMLADKMEDLMKIQVEAIRDLKIDKVTVWDSGNGAGADGKSSTANFISGLMKSVPPMNEIFEMAGMNLPEFLGKKMDKPEDGAVVSAVDAKEIASDAKEVSDDAKEAEAVEAPKAFEAANVSEAAKAEDSTKAAAPAAPAQTAAVAPAKTAPQAPAAETQVPIWEKNPPMNDTQA
ncbi:MAG: SPFH domain-containing protein [Saccharofermentanaceae bacterium]|nr:SPFH domain-containing protein [Saccharofermentanaceae bacterium]